MIKTEEIFDRLDWNDRLRCLNFCEIEFGYGGYYDYNNLDGVKEALINEFECSQIEIIDMLYRNEDFSDRDKFFYTNGRYIMSVSEDFIRNEFDIVIKNLCNGELKEMIEDMINDDINY